jgi:hypothetical protein
MSRRSGRSKDRFGFNQLRGDTDAIAAHAYAAFEHVRTP